MRWVLERSCAASFSNATLDIPSENLFLYEIHDKELIVCVVKAKHRKETRQSPRKNGKNLIQVFDMLRDLCFFAV